VFRYTPFRHWLLLAIFAVGLAGIVIEVVYGFNEIAASIGLLAGWAIGLAQGLNARIVEDARQRVKKVGR